MRPLRLALVHRDHWYRGEARIDGQFAYEVPGLVWSHHQVGKGFEFDIKPLKDVDVVWLDEGRYREMRFRPAKGERESPVVFWVVYPTLAGHIRETRKAQVEEQVDLVLLDHDRLENWAGFPVRRLAYSVNERYYRDRGLARDVDVGFYCVWGYNPARPAFDAWLADLCRRKGWTFANTGGTWIGTEYAELLSRTKVVVHLNRTPETRPARIFDCAASGAAFLGNPMPAVSGEYWTRWLQYGAFDYPVDQYTEDAKAPSPQFDDTECEQVVVGLERMLDWGEWEAIAQNAKAYVLACHTWERRAWELRGVLLDAFPHLREQVGETWAYQ